MSDLHNETEISKVFPCVKEITVMKVDSDTCLIVHIPRDMASGEVCDNIARSLRHVGFKGHVLIDNIGLKFDLLSIEGAKFYPEMKNKLLE